MMMNKMDLKTKMANCVRQSLLQSGVDSYKVDLILNVLVDDIITVLKELENEQAGNR